MTEVGVVVVGRNEGPRLGPCLRSVLRCTRTLLYVDSGSRDDSVAQARQTGVPLLQLDPGRPFSAARARNEGFQQLLSQHPWLQYVQFVDGDCQLDAEWLQRGRELLSQQRQVTVVCGRIRELRPEASPYNRMCALEWDQPAGEVRASGGNLMVRVSAFRDLGGFRDDVLAAEDDELCLRVRRAGGRIYLLDAPMVLHDADVLRFSQWWRRARRCGQAYAQGFALHGRPPQNHFRRETRSLILWGALWPLLVALVGSFTRGAGLFLLAAYPALGLRIVRHGLGRGWPLRHAVLYAVFTVLSKFPGVLGMLHFHLQLWRGHAPSLIEHKEMRLGHE